MNRKARILGVAPYEGLRLLMNQIAERRDDIEMTAIYGNLEHGAELIKNIDKEYDIIISRARTADLILDNTYIPVIDIGISYYDVLRCIKQAENSGNKFAIIGFHALTSMAKPICELMQYDIEIFPVSTQDNVETILQEIKAQGYTTIICDTQPYAKAKLLGITPILLTSGEESVNSAVDKAIRQFEIQQKQLNIIDMLKNMSVLDNSLCIALSNDKTLLYSSKAPQEIAYIIEALKKEINESEQSQPDNYFINIANTVYSITKRNYFGIAQPYTLFRLSPSSIPLSYSKNGVTILDKKKAEASFINSFYSYTKLSKQLLNDIDNINETNDTVMITGEIGTGKDRIAQMIYARSKYCSNPLYVVNCSLINDRNWTFLTTNYNSPFTDNKNTIYISSINALDITRQKQLLSIITDTNLHIRNRIILSCSRKSGEPIPHMAMRFVNMISCNVINIPSMRESPDDIASSANLYLDSLNQQLVKQVVGFDKSAMDLLQQYSWPYNRTQFKRVLKEIITLTPTPYVSADIVYKILKQENNFNDHQNTNSGNWSSSPAKHGSNVVLDLSKTWNEINKDVALLVVERCNGNQTAAAKQLGISRTTLWRLLSK